MHDFCIYSVPQGGNMRKILIALLALVLSLSACSPAEDTTKKTDEKVEEKAEPKEEEKTEPKEEEKEEPKEESVDSDKALEEFINKPLAKAEANLEVKDFPLAAIDVTSDTDQTLVLKNKDAKTEDLVIKLPAGVKTPVYFTENVASATLVTPEGADDKANVTFAKHEKVRQTEPTNGLWLVGFSDDITPGSFVFEKANKDIKVIKLSKYGSVKEIEFKEDKDGKFLSEEITLLAGDKILVDGEKVSIIDITQQRIDELNKKAEEEAKKAEEKEKKK